MLTCLSFPFYRACFKGLHNGLLSDIHSVIMFFSSFHLSHAKLSKLSSFAFVIFFSRKSYLIIIAVVINTVASSLRCPCQLVVDCPDGIRSNFGSFPSSPTCESSDIRCCVASRASTNDPSRISQNIFEKQVRNAPDDTFRNPSDPSLVKKVKRFASMVHGLSLGIPLKNFVCSECLRTTDSARDFGDTRHNDPEEMDADIALRYVQRIAIRTKQVQPAASNTISDGVQSARSDDSARKNLMNNVAKEITSPPVTILYPESIKTDAHFFLIPAGDVRSTIGSNDGSKRRLSQQPIDEAASFESVKISPRSHRHARALHPTTSAETTDNDTRNTINLSMVNSINNRTAIPSEFGENISRASAHYGRQSMVSSPPKDLPTTPAINSFEQKTSSETFLALDRISTQLIDKNTPTADGEPRAPRGNGGAVFVAVKTSLPYFSAGNPPRDSGQELARKRVGCEQKEMREETSKDDREALSVEGVTSMPRRRDPLRAMRRVKRLTVSAAASTALRKNISKTNNTAQPEKDKNVKNTEKAGYRSETAEKRPPNAKSLRSSSLEARIKNGKGSADTNTRNTTVKTIIVPVRPRVRFPPKVLPIKFAPHKQTREPTSNARFNSSERYLSGYFHDFYEARESLRTKIEEKVKCERRKTRKRPISLYRRENENVSLKNETENYAIATKTFNVSGINISTDFNGKNSSASISNLQDKIPVSIINTANVSEANNSDNSDGNSTSVSNLVPNLQNKILEPRTLNVSEINKSIDFNSSISNLESNILASDIKMFDTSEVYHSINSDRNNHASASDFSTMNPQDKTLTSKKTRAYLNTSVSSQEVTKRSMQIEIINISDTNVPSVQHEKSLDVLSKEARKIDEHHSEQLPKFQRKE